MLSKISLIAAALAGMASMAGAQTAPAGGPDPAKFAEHKQLELQRIGQRMQALQTLQSCVQAAPDHAALRSCNESARASMGRGGHRGGPERAMN